MNRKKRGWLKGEVESLQDDERRYKSLNISHLAHFEGLNPQELDDEEDGALYDFINALEVLPVDICTLEDAVVWSNLLTRYRLKVAKTENRSRQQFTEYLANKLTTISNKIQLTFRHKANSQ